MGEKLQLVLASASPRRRELLEGLGLEHTVRPAAVDETMREGESACEHVLRLAEAKSQVYARQGELVLAADTVVIVDGEVLGKPADEDDARSMLGRLSGRSHQVMTGLAVHDPARAIRLAQVERTEVRFAELSEREIEWYVATGEPLDKAGAYGIQGHAALFIESIAGSYTNVVGLPLQTTYRLLRAAGFDILSIPGVNHRT